MSVFKNVRIYPSHGTRSAVVTWEIEAGTDPGDVYVAFSLTGTPGSWELRNFENPVPSEIGVFQDTALVLNAGRDEGFYRMMLRTEDAQELYSETLRIMGDLAPHEYGAVRAMIHREYQMMRVSDGFPVWHCIPRAHGTLADTVDPDTGVINGLGCEEAPGEESYGLRFREGFYPPVLTWLRVVALSEGLKDDPEKFSIEDTTKTTVRMMAFPKPMRGHMLVDPTTDRRWLVTDEIRPYLHRGVIAVAYEATLEFLQQNDVRYKFTLPNFDTREYRGMRYWNPTTPVDWFPD